MEFVLLGYKFSDESLSKARKYSNKGVQIAPHLFLNHFIDGLEENLGYDIFVYSIPPVGSFPFNYKCRKLFDNCYAKNKTEIGYNNIPFLKHSEQKHKLLKTILSNKTICSADKVIFLIYSLDDVFVSVCKELSKKIKNSYFFLIQTDAIPGIDDMKSHINWIKRIKSKLILKKTKFIKGYILFTEYLTEPLKLFEKRWMLLDCIADSLQPINSCTNGRNKNYLYYGTLIEEYNLKTLIEAFDYLDEEKLYICGSGELEKYIEKVAMTKKNIIYCGFLNQQELFNLRENVDFLINPRQPTGTYTKYSFPSKVPDYMMSGKPVIMYKLEGISNEYSPFLNYLSSKDAFGISKELKSIEGINYSELTSKAFKGRNFILQNKNQKVQTKRVIDFIFDTIQYDKN